MPQIFTNPAALEETIDDVDLSDKQIAEAKRLKKKLDSWQSQKQSKIIAYVGRFGSGKSATLKHVESLYEQSKAKKKPRWLTFEAWRYADRAKLWDGFVLELSDTLGGHKGREKTADKIRGIAGIGRYVHRHPLQVFAYTTIVWLIVSTITWLALYDHTDTISLLIKAILKYAASMLLGMLALAGVTTLFRQKAAPLTRVEELEKLLGEALGKLKWPLIIVTEDIDRAGDEGIVFLETLRHFLNTQPDTQPVIIIAPQDVTYMSALNEDKIKGLERSVKIYDDALYYGSSLIQAGDTTKLLELAGIKDEYRDSLVQVAGEILRHYKGQLSLRLLKFIFREVEAFAESQDKIDPSIAFVFITMRYLRHDENGKKSQTYLQLFDRTPINNMHLSISNTNIAPIVKILAQRAGVTTSISQCNLSFDTGMTDETSAEEVRGHVNSSLDIKLHIHERYQALLS